MQFDDGRASKSLRFLSGGFASPPQPQGCHFWVLISFFEFFFRMPVCGMGSVFCMTVMAAWSKRRGPSPGFSKWIQILRKRTISIFNLVSFISNKRSLTELSRFLSLFPKCLNISQCFGYVLNSPPRPLSKNDIWFQIGHTKELMKEVGWIFFETPIICFAAR